VLDDPSQPGSRVLRPTDEGGEAAAVEHASG
jgi:hypothetical protein